jgi:hypothetical protein
MHSPILIYITICIELFIFLCGLNFLAKIRRDSLGKVYRWLTCIVLTITALLIICTIATGICRMCCHHKYEKCIEMEKCYGGMGGHGMMMIHGGCNDMPCCKEMEGEEGGCPFDKKGKCMGDEKKCKEMMEKDTVVNKADTKVKK